jgi:hypothetical protein
MSQPYWNGEIDMYSKSNSRRTATEVMQSQLAQLKQDMYAQMLYAATPSFYGNSAAQVLLEIMNKQQHKNKLLLLC